MSRAAWGSIAFFIGAPGSAAGLVPWLITRWNGMAGPLPVTLGAVLVLAGSLLVVAAFVQFVVEGRGTPAPVAPTQELVVGGLYRWVRNPMYVGVSSAIAGQALIFADVGVMVWLGLFLLAVVSFVRFYEEPTLRRTYGDAYIRYCREVPGWWPRLRPWTSTQS